MKATPTNKYVAPYLREGGAGRGTGREPPGARRDDIAAIRISNLSNFAVEADLEDLVKGFGPVQKLYLAKEKVPSTFLIQMWKQDKFKMSQFNQQLTIHIIVLVSLITWHQLT